MAGQPRRRAMIDTLAQLGGPEWIELQVADGRTLLDIADELSRRSGENISRTMVSRYAREIGLDLDRVRAEDASFALVDEATRLAESAEADRDELARAKLRIDHKLKLAAFWNRERFGEKAQAAITVNLGSLHLTAAREAPTLPIPGAEVEVEVEVEVLPAGEE